MKKLKDKIFRDVTIKIDKWQEVTQDGCTTNFNTIAFLVTIEQGQGRKTMFRVDTVRNLWKEIKHFAMIYKQGVIMRIYFYKDCWFPLSSELKQKLTLWDDDLSLLEYLVIIICFLLDIILFPLYILFFVKIRR